MADYEQVDINNNVLNPLVDLTLVRLALIYWSAI